MRARHSARAAGATLSVWLLGIALSGCSLLVDSELDGRDLSKKFVGFANGDASMNGRDGSADGDGRNGGGGAGSSAGGNGGRGDQQDGGVGMDGGSGMDGGPGEDSGASADSGEADAGHDGGADAAQDTGSPAPLMIASATPAADSSTTANVTSIAIVFSEAVQAVGAADLQLRDGGGGLIAGTLDTSGATVTFTPTQPLRSVDSYHVTVGGGVTASASGVTLGDAQQWVFSIVTGFANDPTAIDLASTAGGSWPAVAADADGNALVAWVQNGAASGASTIWHAFYRSGSGWSTASELDARSGHAGPPSVAMTPDGTAFVAWTQATNAGGLVLVRRYDPRSGWAEPVPLDTDPDISSASLPVGVGVNAMGHAGVAWVRGADSMANGIGHLYFAAYGGGSWSSAVEVLDAGGNSTNATGDIQVAVNGTGLAAIGTFGNTDATLFVQQAGMLNWATPFKDYDYTPARRMAVTVGPLDAFFAGCHDPEGGGNELARVAGSSVQLRSSTVGNSAYSIDPKLSIAADADAVAAFLAVHDGATSVSVQALSYDSNVVDWAVSSTDVFPNRGSLVPSQPDVTVYGTSALIAWEAGGNLYTVERAPSRSYSAAAMRSHVAGNVLAESVQVAAGSNGNGVIVWAEGASPPHIAAQTFRGVR